MRVLGKDFTDEEMLDVLRHFYKENSRHPYIKDFKGKKPSSDMIARRFGSWNKALELAEIPRERDKTNCYSKEELKKYLIEYHQKYNKIPTARGMRSKGYPTIHAYINHFGSFKNALIETNLFELREDKHQFCDEYTNNELLDYLKVYIDKKNGRIPTYEVMKEDLFPSLSTYERRFDGGVLGAFKIIGYEIEKQRESDLKLLKEDMVKNYKDLAIKLGRTPSSRDIEDFSRKDGSINSMSSYEFHFGSLYNLQVLCNLNPTVIGRNKTKDDMINDIHKMKEELQRTPSQLDVKYFDFVASVKKYIDEFGSWRNAIKEAGLEPLKKVYKSQNGETCLSVYELNFTNMLEKYNIKFEKEVFYKDYIDIDKRYRFDYKINIDGKIVFVEIFGMLNNMMYENKIKEKIDLCKDNNLPLIELYPNDFGTRDLEKIYNMFKIHLLKHNINIK